MKNSFLVLILCFCFSTWAAKERYITVMGHCLKSVTADRGSVDFFAEVVNLNPQKAMQEATKTFEKARDQVKKLNLKNLELSTLENSLQEERVWENNKNVFKGYRARIGLRVYTSQWERLSEVLAVVSKEGIKSLGGLQTDVSPQKLKEEQESCLEVAIENAKAKALKVAKASGGKLGAVLVVDETGEDRTPPPRAGAVMEFAKVKSEMSMAPVDTKAESLSVSVRVSFALE